MAKKLLPFSDFLKLVKVECKHSGVEFRQAKGKFVTCNGTKVQGYFDDGKHPILAIAMGAKEYKTTLAHEYSHLCQWSEGIVLWGLCDESSRKVDDWLAGKEVKDIKAHISIVRSLELDAEIRTAELMNIYDFGMTKEHYTKTANAYIMFHNWMLTTRRWSRVGHPASANQRIVHAMSDKFDMDYSKLSPKIRKLFREEDI